LWARSLQLPWSRTLPRFASCERLHHQQNLQLVSAGRHKVSPAAIIAAVIIVKIAASAQHIQQLAHLSVDNFESLIATLRAPNCICNLPATPKQVSLKLTANASQPTDRHTRNNAALHHSKPQLGARAPLLPLSSSSQGPSLKRKQRRLRLRALTSDAVDQWLYIRASDLD
jgi:hypothetical protein